MKKLIMIALLCVGMTSMAQKKSAESKSEKPEWTAAQRNEIKLKELTLALDLTASQQTEMAKIISEQQAKREQMMAERKAKATDAKKLTSEEKFVMKNRMLDEKIAMKARLKKILTAEQLEKYGKMKHHRKDKMKKHLRNRKMRSDTKG